MKKLIFKKVINLFNINGQCITLIQTELLHTSTLKNYLKILPSLMIQFSFKRFGRERAQN